MTLQDRDQHDEQDPGAPRDDVSAENRIARCTRGQCSKLPKNATLWMDVDEYERRAVIAQSLKAGPASSTTTKQYFRLSTRQHFRLFDLPLELRHRIYEFALSPDEHFGYSREPWSSSPLIHVPYDNNVKRSTQPYNIMNWAIGTTNDERWWVGEPALTRVSYVVRQETLPIYYATETVVFHFTGLHWSELAPSEAIFECLEFCHLISREKLSMCRSIEFGCCLWELEGPYDLGEGVEDLIDREDSLSGMVKAAERTGLQWDAINLPVDYQWAPPTGVPRLVGFEHPKLGYDRNATKAAFDKSYASANKLRYIKLAPTSAFKVKSKGEDAFVDDMRRKMRKVLGDTDESARQETLMLETSRLAEGGGVTGDRDEIN